MSYYASDYSNYSFKNNSEGGRLELELPVPLLSLELSELLLGKLLLLLGRLLLGRVGGPLQAISAKYHSLSRDSRVTMPGISPFIPPLCLSQQNAYDARNYARIIAASLDTAYPSVDPGRNAAVGVKHAISNHTTAAVPLYYVSTAL